MFPIYTSHTLIGIFSDSNNRFLPVHWFGGLLSNISHKKLVKNTNWLMRMSCKLLKSKLLLQHHFQKNNGNKFCAEVF